MPTALVIGSGIAGIAASIRLKSKGFDVDVYEKNAYSGGKLTAFVQDGFRFDAGPSLFTKPDFVTELFTLLGENPEQEFPYVKLPVACHYFYADGTFVRAFAERKKLLTELNEKLNIDPEAVNAYLDYSAFVYKTTSPVFLEQSLHRFSNFLNLKTAKGLALMPWLGIFNKLNQLNEQKLKHPKLVQLFNRYATYNGSDPYQCPGVMSAIPHLEFNEGAFFPKNGMHQISQSLMKLAERHGVRFHFNSTVERILVSNQKANGIVVNGEELKADVVVCNSDAWTTYRHLLKDQKQPEKILNQPRSSSALIFYWGIRKQFPQLDMHNIFFSADYKAEFDAIFQQNSVYHDPTVYINITSKQKPDDAPPGCENWFVMVNVPPDNGQNWEKLIKATRENVLNKLSQHLNENVAQLIVNESVLDPSTIQSRTASYQGSLYGTSSNNRYAAFLRHPNFSKQIANLYFCGGSVHPGGGIPLCLLSAKIATEHISS